MWLRCTGAEQPSRRAPKKAKRAHPRKGHDAAAAAAQPSKREGAARREAEHQKTSATPMPIIEYNLSFRDDDSDEQRSGQESCVICKARRAPRSQPMRARARCMPMHTDARHGHAEARRERSGVGRRASGRSLMGGVRWVSARPPSWLLCVASRGRRRVSAGLRAASAVLRRPRAGRRGRPRGDGAPHVQGAFARACPCARLPRVLRQRRNHRVARAIERAT